MDRRDFLRTTAATAGVVASSGIVASCLASTAHASTALGASQNTSSSAAQDEVLAQHYPFTLPALGYANDAVEPAVDTMTMSIHHDKHHAAYVTNLNNALAQQPALQTKTLKELLTSLASVPDAVRNAVRNNAGGHANHALYWQLLAPGGAKAPSGALLTAINKDFGSQTACVAALKAAGLGQFGSGWTWLVRDSTGKLVVRATPNQDTPLSDGMRVIVGVDVWEHAYYLKYQNRRTDYLDAVLGALNWDAAGRAFNS